MSLIEMNHPFASELLTISEAVEGGLEEHWSLPYHLKFKHISPLDDPDGCTVLHIADWETENLTTVSIPVFSSPDNGPAVFYGADKKLTGARIVVKDFLGRAFRMNLDGEVVGVPFTQFDVVEEGIILSSERRGLAVIQVAEFEGDEYNILHEVVRKQASLETLYEIAVEFLGT